jgi:hypothetical protein
MSISHTFSRRKQRTGTLVSGDNNRTNPSEGLASASDYHQDGSCRIPNVNWGMGTIMMGRESRTRRGGSHLIGREISEGRYRYYRTELGGETNRREKGLFTSTFCGGCAALNGRIPVTNEGHASGSAPRKRGCRQSVGNSRPRSTGKNGEHNT